MYIETPKPPLLLGFRLTVYPSPQFLQIIGRLYHPSLSHLAVEESKLGMAPSLQRHYSPSSLLRATPPSCCLRPFSVSAVIEPTFSRDFSPGHTGLLQFPSCPCYRVAANTPPV